MVYFNHFSNSQGRIDSQKFTGNMIAAHYSKLAKRFVEILYEEGEGVFNEKLCFFKNMQYAWPK